MTDKATQAKPETAPQEALREEILSDARHQAERLLRRARQEAQSFSEKAAKEFEAWRNEQMEKARAEAARRTGLVVAGIALERGRMRARRIETLLQELYVDLRKRCADRAAVDVKKTVVALAAEALRGMEGTRFTVEVAACDRAALGAKWLDEVRRATGRADLELEARHAEDRRDVGPVVRDADERQAWDNRLAARLERLWPALRRELAKELSLQDSPTPTETTP
jgi:vacuolar-type H+-ATPase subunit E/Vma4